MGRLRRGLLGRDATVWQYTHGTRNKNSISPDNWNVDQPLLDRPGNQDYPGKVERAILFKIEAWDVNCPQHIHQRIALTVVGPEIESLQERIVDLESQLDAIRQMHNR